MHSSSVLYDVAIIYENYIWAVGEIYLNDSLRQPDPNAYGFTIWNGQSWQPKKLLNNNISITLKVLNPDDIYIAAVSIFHLDGVSSEVQ